MDLSQLLNGQKATKVVIDFEDGSRIQWWGRLPIPGDLEDLIARSNRIRQAVEAEDAKVGCAAKGTVQPLGEDILFIDRKGLVRRAATENDPQTEQVLKVIEKAQKDLAKSPQTAMELAVAGPRPKSWPARLKAWRIQHDPDNPVSQSSAAKVAGLSLSSWARFEQGTRQPTAKVAARLEKMGV